MSKIILLVFALSFPFVIFAQFKSDSVIRSRYSLTAGAALTTRGGLVELRSAFGKGKNRYLVCIDAATARSMKEEKIKSWYSNQRVGSDYVFGKANRLMLVCPSIGISRVLFPFDSYNKIAVRADISAGPSFALLRPYYVSINAGGNNFEEMEVPNSTKYDYQTIVGEVNAFKNLSPTQTVIGLGLRTALAFDLSPKTSNLSAVQLALNFDGFSKPIPIMLTQRNTPYLLSACVGFVWGKR